MEKRPLYLNPKELNEAVIEAKAQGRLTDRLAKHLMKIAEGVSLHRWYRNYSYREDIAGQALIALTKHWGKADPEKGTCFNYYSRICFNEAGEYVNDQRRQSDTIDEYGLELGLEPSSGYEDRQNTNSGWSQQREKINEARKKTLSKSKQIKHHTPRTWNPPKPYAYIFDIREQHLDFEESRLVLLAHQTCNALNIVPEFIIWQMHGQELGRTKFDMSLREEKR